MYEDAEVIPFDTERDADGPTALPFKINLGLLDEEEEEEPENDLPEPQFLRAPVDIKVPDDRARVDVSEEDIMNGQEDYNMKGPASIHTLIRHRVSAVLTWHNDDVSVMTSSPVYYHIRYIRQGEGHNVLTQSSDAPVFLLENLHVGTRYMYNITMHSHNSNETLWLKQGVVDTSEMP